MTSWRGNDKRDYYDRPMPKACDDKILKAEEVFAVLATPASEPVLEIGPFRYGTGADDCIYLGVETTEAANNIVQMFKDAPSSVSARIKIEPWTSPGQSRAKVLVAVPPSAHWYLDLLQDLLSLTQKHGRMKISKAFIALAGNPHAAAKEIARKGRAGEMDTVRAAKIVNKLIDANVIPGEKIFIPAVESPQRKSVKPAIFKLFHLDGLRK